MGQKIYIAIDLKSFYASVECVERGLDPMTAHLVVADETRTEKTICLAVSPALKKYGIPGRARLFEVIQKCDEIKARTGEDIQYIIAEPRMKLYMEYSSRVYKIYMKYISHEDMHVYSIDEVFMDVTNYLKMYHGQEDAFTAARKLAAEMANTVFRETGITVTAGVGTNLYLAKVAMDILAKREEPKSEGIRIAELNEQSYRQKLWEHEPITDFWRIGKGTYKRLSRYGVRTMGDIARLSLSQSGYTSGEDLLYQLFGVDAEILIDHAWGIEPCTMRDIKNYKPGTKVMSSGQVLCSGYAYVKGKLIIKEMVESQVLTLVEKELLTDQITLDIGYDRETIPLQYDGPMVLDPYGRTLPKPAHGSLKLKKHTSSTNELIRATLQIYERIMDRNLCMKRVTLSFGNVIAEEKSVEEKYEQMDIFSLLESQEETKEQEERERKLQETMLKIQNRYGKNAVLKGMNLEEGAKTVSRNQQIGGHKA